MLFSAAGTTIEPVTVGRTTKYTVRDRDGHRWGTVATQREANLLAREADAANPTRSQP